MTTLHLGHESYRRAYADMPELVLVNRFLEQDPTNEVEQVSLLARPGSDILLNLPTDDPIRATWSQIGLFGGDIFIVAGTSIWRYGSGISSDGSDILTAISGVVNNNGFVKFAPQWGSSGPLSIFNNLFISDGQLLQYYNGGSHATGTLTVTAGGTNITNQIIKIGSSYYTWGDSTAVLDASANGSLSHPWVALLNDPSVGGSTSDENSLGSMANLLMFNGTPGTNFSISLGGPSTLVTASYTILTLALTANSTTTDGNSIATTVQSGSDLSWGASTLTNGGAQALLGITMPNGVAPNALAAVSSYVLVSVANSQLFYYINPGEQTIDPLNFNAKQSNPDNIVDMVTVGDQVVLVGQGSTENWYATGNANDAFAPYEGRVYMRGGIEGTSVLVKDTLALVGNNGIVYAIGYQFGTEAQWGVNRISTHAIEEHIRKYLRAQQGLVP